MVFCLVPGLDPALHTSVRLFYVEDHRVAWTLSWLVWIGAALSLVYFLTAWGAWLKRGTEERFHAAARFGALVGALGLVPDTIAETLYIGIVPRFAGMIPSGPPEAVTDVLNQFAIWETAATFFTGFLGNGLYCVGGLTLTLVSLKAARASRGVFLAGLPTWIFGFGLSAAALFQHEMGLKIFTALTMASFTVFSGLIAWRGPEADLS